MNFVACCEDTPSNGMSDMFEIKRRSPRWGLTKIHDNDCQGFAEPYPDLLPHLNYGIPNARLVWGVILTIGRL
jgi:hypothetical protein